MNREERAGSTDSVVTDDSEDPLTCPLTQRLFQANFTAHASRRVVGQWGGAGGASCEDHFALVCVRAARAATWWSIKNRIKTGFPQLSPRVATDLGVPRVDETRRRDH